MKTIFTLIFLFIVQLSKSQDSLFLFVSNKNCVKVDSCSFIDVSINNKFSFDIIGYLSIEILDSNSKWIEIQSDVFTRTTSLQPIFIQYKNSAVFNIPIRNLDMDFLKNSNKKHFRIVLKYYDKNLRISYKPPNLPKSWTYKLQSIASKENIFFCD
jgi:hypothetical protein